MTHQPCSENCLRPQVHTIALPWNLVQLVVKTCTEACHHPVVAHMAAEIDSERHSKRLRVSVLVTTQNIQLSGLQTNMPPSEVQLVICRVVSIAAQRLEIPDPSVYYFYSPSQLQWEESMLVTIGFRSNRNAMHAFTWLNFLLDICQKDWDFKYTRPDRHRMRSPSLTDSSPQQQRRTRA